MRNEPLEIDSGRGETVRRHFIPEWAAARNKTPSDIARHTGADKSLVSRWLKKGTLPTVEYLKSLAELFDLEDTSELFRRPPAAEVAEEEAPLPFPDDEAAEEADTGADLLDYAGIVEAGVFREVDELDQRLPHKLPYLRSPKYPKARHLAFKVMGDSMDLEKIFEGMWVEGVDMEEFFDHYGDLQDGDLVVVERSEAQGALRERTVKVLAFFPDHWELHPRSSNPKHQKMTIPRGYDPEKTSSVSIIALVVRWFMERERR